jgi:hypothetical protein
MQTYKLMPCLLAGMPTNNMDEDDMDEESHEESPEEDVTSSNYTLTHAKLLFYNFN